MPVLHAITRFEVIDTTGRRVVSWPCNIELSYQDDGRTLKVFVDREVNVFPPTVIGSVFNGS